MTALTLAGPVARLDTPTADQRMLLRSGYSPPRGEVPVVALYAGVRPGGQFGAEPVGQVTDWTLDGDGVLAVAGEVFDDQLIPAGSYPCGVEARFEPGDVEVEASGLTVIRRWSPLAVVLHLPGSAGVAAWPDLPPLLVG